MAPRGILSDSKPYLSGRKGLLNSYDCSQGPRIVIPKLAGNERERQLCFALHTLSRGYCSVKHVTCDLEVKTKRYFI